MSRLLDTLTKQFDRDVALAKEQRPAAEPTPEPAPAPVEPPQVYVGNYTLPSILGIAFGAEGQPGFEWEPDNLAEVYGSDPTRFIRQVKDEMEKLELKDRELYAERDRAHSVSARRKVEAKLDASDVAWRRLGQLANPSIDGQPLTIQCRTRTPLGRCEGLLWRTENAAQAGRCLGCINTLYYGRTV